MPILRTIVLCCLAASLLMGATVSAVFCRGIIPLPRPRCHRAGLGLGFDGAGVQGTLPFCGWGGSGWVFGGWTWFGCLFEEMGGSETWEHIL